MNVSPSEAQEALETIQAVMKKTRHSIAGGGAYVSVIITGVIWMVGFMGTQFLSNQLAAIVWGGASVIGSTLAIILGSRRDKQVRNPTASATAKRIGLFWLFLVFYCLAVLAVTWPLDGKQVTVVIVLFTMIGQLGMGLLLSFSSVWWALPISALTLVGYFVVPDYFYLWMSLLGGGGMIALGLVIRSRW